MKTLTKVFRLIVDYDQPFDQMISRLGCDRVDPNITEDKFPSEESGSQEVEFVLYSTAVNGFDKCLKEMETKGLRSTTLKELAAFGTRYPNMQLEFPIMTLNSVWGIFRGRCFVPYLGRWLDGRGLNLHWFDNDWLGDNQFLAVRK